MSKKIKESFIFYRSFFESISLLPESEQLGIYKAICDMALNETKHELDGMQLAIYKLVEPQLLANNRRYKNACKGGRPKNQKETKSKPKKNQSETKPKANDNDNVNDNDNETDNEGFERAWTLYQRKGSKAASKKYWGKLSAADRASIIAKIPLYLEDKPEVRYRKDFQGWINPANRLWEVKTISELEQEVRKPSRTEETIGELEQF